MFLLLLSAGMILNTYVILGHDGRNRLGHNFGRVRRDVLPPRSVGSLKYNVNLISLYKIHKQT